MDVDAFETDRDGGEDVLDARLVFATVAVLAHAVAIDELADRALDSDPPRVVRQPFLGLLLSPRFGLDLAEIAREDGDFPGTGAGRGGLDRALPAVVDALSKLARLYSHPSSDT
nr:hypothetical protein [Streptomyces sp. MBT53]